MRGILEYSCREPGCVREFGSARGLELHRIDVHGTEKEGGTMAEHQCPDCGKAFDRPQSLGAHRARAHGYRRATTPPAGDPPKAARRRRTPRPKAEESAIRLLLVREGRVTLSLADIAALHPEFSLEGHRFRILAGRADGGFDCEILD